MMSITPNADILANYDLIQIFSHLDLSDMPQVACVCRRWRDILRSTDEIWMSFCQNRLREAHPHRGLCRDRCKLIRNWGSGNAKVTDFSSKGKLRREMIILEDNTTWELFEDPQRPRCLIVRDLKGMRPPIRIDLNEHRCGRVVANLVQEGSFLVLDQNRTIFSFDIRTGKCISKILGEDPVNGNSISKIFLNDREIIVLHNEKIIIYDRVSLERLHIFGVHGLGDISAVVSTPNFVIVSTRTISNIRMIHKGGFLAGPRRKILATTLENTFLFRCLGSLGSYCAFLSPKGEVKVYEDDPERGFVLLHTLIVQNSCRFTLENVVHDTCKNLLAVSFFGKLYVWDFVQGKEVSRMDLPHNYMRIRINEGGLLARVVGQVPFGRLKFRYTLFDFTSEEKRSRALSNFGRAFLFMLRPY